MLDDRPPDPRGGTGFLTTALGWGQRHGFRGGVWVELTPAGLLLSGEQEGRLLIAPKQVHRLRSTVERRKSGDVPTSSIWTRDDPQGQPIVLQVGRVDGAVFASVMHDFATLVAADGGLGRLERGSSMGRAILPMLLTGPALPVLAVVSFLVLGQEPWPVRFLPLAIGLMLELFALALFLAHRPRPLRDLDDHRRALQLVRGRASSSG